jgi:hypothetical protein
MKHDIRIELKGSVLDATATLKKLPGNAPDEKHNFVSSGDSRSCNIKGKELGSALVYKVFCKGINGTLVNFEIFVNEISKKKFSGTIENGKFEKEDNIIL